MGRFDIKYNVFFMAYLLSGGTILSLHSGRRSLTLTRLRVIPACHRLPSSGGRNDQMACLGFPREQFIPGNTNKSPSNQAVGHQRNQAHQAARAPVVNGLLNATKAIIVLLQLSLNRIFIKENMLNGFSL